MSKRTPSASPVPRVPTIDSTLALLREGYPFVHRRMQDFGSDAFRARLLGKEVLFLTGPKATEVFYDQTRFYRAGAAPLSVKKTLFGSGGVQGLDDGEHRERKALFMSVLTKDHLTRLLQTTNEQWISAASLWPSRERIVLFDESAKLLGRAVCTWAGLHLARDEQRQLTEQCVAMVDGFASAGIRLGRALIARQRAERWARTVIEEIRNGSLEVPTNSPAGRIAEHVTQSGTQLSSQIAGVELLNIIRPTVAIAWWVAFVGEALHAHPEYVDRLRSDTSFAEPFVREIRRLYPFTPFVGAKARVAFEWDGIHFERDQLVILDVYGTLRDGRWWESPESFRPERFVDRSIGPFDYIPNGGGDVMAGHRCAGEAVVNGVLAQAATVLTRNLQYRIPPQDLGYPLDRIPTRPTSGVVMDRIRAS